MNIRDVAQLIIAEYAQSISAKPAIAIKRARIVALPPYAA